MTHFCFAEHLKHNPDIPTATQTPMPHSSTVKHVADIVLRRVLADADNPD
jgi:hypothetical protein